MVLAPAPGRTVTASGGGPAAASPGTELASVQAVASGTESAAAAVSGASAMASVWGRDELPAASVPRAGPRTSLPADRRRRRGWRRWRQRSCAAFGACGAVRPAAAPRSAAAAARPRLPPRPASAAPRRGQPCVTASPWSRRSRTGRAPGPAVRGPAWPSPFRPARPSRRRSAPRSARTGGTARAHDAAPRALSAVRL